MSYSLRAGEERSSDHGFARHRIAVHLALWQRALTTPHDGPRQRTDGLPAHPSANGNRMSDDPLRELAPVDFVIVEFPAGAQNFTGEAAEIFFANELLICIKS